MSDNVKLNTYDWLQSLIPQSGVLSTRNRDLDCTAASIYKKERKGEEQFFVDLFCRRKTNGIAEQIKLPILPERGSTFFDDLEAIAQQAKLPIHSFCTHCNIVPKQSKDNTVLIGSSFDLTFILTLLPPKKRNTPTKFTGYGNNFTIDLPEVHKVQYRGKPVGDCIVSSDGINLCGQLFPANPNQCIEKVVDVLLKESFYTKGKNSNTLAIPGVNHPSWKHTQEVTARFLYELGILAEHQSDIELNLVIEEIAEMLERESV